jgi:TonB-linked SusC/RagA family outer membrane protein
MKDKAFNNCIFFCKQKSKEMIRMMTVSGLLLACIFRLPAVEERAQNAMATLPSGVSGRAVERPDQQPGKKITGRVTDDTGETVIGANVVEKGTMNGAITDEDGRFSLTVSEDAVIQISFVGYVRQEITVGAQTDLQITLLEDAEALEEVVVVGYGTQKKVNLTGSVSSVDMNKMLEGRAVTSISAGLAGMAPGVFVTQGAGGRPGHDGATIRVRGQGSLNNSDPLIVIDGAAGNMNDVDPQDVESISILKDAASSSIYGSRAANGVILITTRKGAQGTSKITYNGYLSSQSVARKLDIVSNYADYMELFNEACANSRLQPKFSREKIDEWRKAGNSDPLKYPNQDWQDAVFHSGLLQSHALSVSGGTDKVRYYMSGNVMDNPGIMDNSGYHRISARSNLDATVKPWFTAGISAYGYNGKADLGLDEEQRFPFLRGTTPGMVFRAPDGRYGGMNNPEDDPQSANNNILKGLNSMKGNRTTNKIVSRFYGTLKPLEGLSIEGSYTYDFQNTYHYGQPVFIPPRDLFGKNG